ncbi:MAG: glycosyltransferase family 2 protein [Lysobacterales bacterium]
MSDISAATLTVVVPVLNEAVNLRDFHTRLSAALEALELTWNVLFVDDGSTDDSLTIVTELAAANPNIQWLSLSRNFGKELAMTAGLDHTVSDAVVIIDADLQDPPEVIPTLVSRWQEGFDVVYAQRTARDGESLIKRSTAAGFYRVINWLSRTQVPPDTGDFRLLSRRTVDALARLRERHRFMKGLFAWVGYRQTAVPYRREARLGGQSKFNYRRLWQFAMEGITSFSNIPLKAASYLGLLAAASALGYGLYIIFKTLIYGDPVPGYPSLMVVILFLGGIQLIALGVIGEYLGRVFEEAKRRPLYLVESDNLGSRDAPDNEQ